MRFSFFIVTSWVLRWTLSEKKLTKKKKKCSRLSKFLATQSKHNGQMGMVRQDIFKKISFLFAINYVDGNLKIFLMARANSHFSKHNHIFRRKNKMAKKCSNNTFFRKKNGTYCFFLFQTNCVCFFSLRKRKRRANNHLRAKNQPRSSLCYYDLVQ